MSRSSGFTLLIPCKELSQAKSRTRLPEHLRAALAHAFIEDVVAVARRTPGVAEILLVSPDPLVGGLARSLAVGFGWTTAARRTSARRWRPDSARSASSRAAASRSWSLTSPGSPSGSCRQRCAGRRALRRAQAAESRPVFVADESGSGTTFLAGMDPLRLEPSFGPCSAHKHHLKGYLDIPDTVPGLRADVDTMRDLHELADMQPLGGATTSLLPRVLATSSEQSLLADSRDAGGRR